MSHVKAIAFDFDGVLFESVDVKTEAFKQLFSREDPSQLKKIVDYHVRNGGVSRFEKLRTIYSEILKRPLSEKEYDHLCREFSRLVIDEVVAAPWVPGAREFLEGNAKKYSFFIVSATPDAEIKEIVERKGIRPFFEEVLGSPRRKKLLLKELLTRHKLRASELVYVGDSGNDWEAAWQTRVAFIWRRLTPETTLPSNFSGPVISSLTKLEDCLASINRKGPWQEGLLKDENK